MTQYPSKSTKYPVRCPDCGHLYGYPGYETSWHWRNCPSAGDRLITNYRPLAWPKFTSRAGDLLIAILCFAIIAIALATAAAHGEDRRCQELRQQHAAQWRIDRVCP